MASSTRWVPLTDESLYRIFSAALNVLNILRTSCEFGRVVLRTRASSDSMLVIWYNTYAKLKFEAPRQEGQESAIEQHHSAAWQNTRPDIILWFHLNFVSPLYVTVRDSQKSRFKHFTLPHSLPQQKLKCYHSKIMYNVNPRVTPTPTWSK